MADVPTFKEYLAVLKEAGITTRSARGFWGGVNTDGDIVVTSWEDDILEDGRRRCWRPRDNKGGLLAMWEKGRIDIGALVKVIVVRQDPKQPPGNVQCATLLPGRYRIANFISGKRGGRGALVEKVLPSLSG